MRFFTILFFGVIAPIAATAAGNPADIEGVYWALTKTGGKLQAEIRDGELEVSVIAVPHERRDQKDIYNDEESLRERRVLGLTVMDGFTYDADEEKWTGGTIYDPKKGKRYDGAVWLDESGNLVARGHIFLPIFSETKTFQKVAGPNPTQPQEGEPPLYHLSEEAGAMRGRSTK